MQRMMHRAQGWDAVIHGLIAVLRTYDAGCYDFAPSVLRDWIRKAWIHRRESRIAYAVDAGRDLSEDEESMLRRGRLFVRMPKTGLDPAADA